MKRSDELREKHILMRFEDLNYRQKDSQYRNREVEIREKEFHFLQHEDKRGEDDELLQRMKMNKFAPYMLNIDTYIKMGQKEKDQEAMTQIESILHFIGAAE